MIIIPSVCTNLWFPDSRKHLDAFRRMAEHLSGLGIANMEYYHDGDGADKVGSALQQAGLTSVLIAVIPLKEQLLHLCGTDEDNRRRAVLLCQDLADQASGSGASTMMICSGRSEPGHEDACMDQLLRSIEQLHEHIARKNLKLQVELEPCDSKMDARQFIGPYQRTALMCDLLAARGIPLRLTMDSAHTAEEGQDFLEALTATKKYCNHIHFANCQIADPSDPLYGDKHLGYEYDNTPFTFDALHQLMPRLEALYPGDEMLTIGMECLCRQDDPFEYFDDTWARLRLIRREQTT